MSDDVSVGRIGSLRRLSPTNRVLRLGVAVMPGVAWGATALASTASPLVLLLVMALTVACALIPDSHLGFLVMVVLLVQWLSAVDDPRTGWTVVMAISLLLFHVSLAAATVTPPAARWTGSMHHRWAVRTSVAATAAVGAWFMVRVFATADVGGSAALLGGTLALVVIAGLWVRARSLTGGH